MTSDDLTLEVLREIRDATRVNRDAIQEVRDAIHENRDAIHEVRDATRDNGHRLDHVDATLVQMAEKQVFIVRHLKTLTEGDTHLEDRVDDLEARVTRLEKR